MVDPPHEPNENTIVARQEMALPSGNTLDIRVPQGLYSVTAWSSSVLRAAGSCQSGDTERTQDIGPQPDGALTVQTVMESGKPLPRDAPAFLQFLATNPTLSDGTISPINQIHGGVLQTDSFIPLNLAPGVYHVRARSLAAGVYVTDVRSENRDLMDSDLEVLAGTATKITVVLSEDAKLLGGTVFDETGNPVSGAGVVLLADNRSQLTKSVEVQADATGQFAIYAAPGTYHLFAWHRMEGAAYLNAEFMKPYESRGAPVTIEKGVPQTVNLRTLDKR
jgi:hypothetical protein